MLDSFGADQSTVTTDIEEVRKLLKRNPHSRFACTQSSDAAEMFVVSPPPNIIASDLTTPNEEMKTSPKLGRRGIFAVLFVHTFTFLTLGFLVLF